MKHAALELKGVSKRFGSILANNNIDLTVYKGEILSILGENGSGKTTLMNMISGIYFPDEGHIYIEGAEVVIRSPRDAFDYGIGMIHQHFKLVDVFSATENIILGLEEKGKYNIKKAAVKVREISEKYGFEIDPDKKIYQMSVSENQTVEIIKVLYRGADILILDEVLSVGDIQFKKKSFKKMQELISAQDRTVVIVSHSDETIRKLCSRVIWLNDGELVMDGETEEVLTAYEAYMEEFDPKFLVKTKKAKKEEKIMRLVEEEAKRAEMS